MSSLKQRLGLALLLSCGPGLSALAAPPRLHETARQVDHGAATSVPRSASVGSQSAFFSSTDGGATWSSGTNTGGSTGIFTDGVFPPFQVLSNGSVGSAFEPLSAGRGAVSFAIGGSASGSRAGDEWIAIGNLVSAVDRNGVPHFLTIAVLANDLNPGVADTQVHSGIAHYVVPPGTSTPVLVNVVVLHSSTENQPGFEDKPWIAYNAATDTMYGSWTHFGSGNTAQSTIEVSRLANASSAVTGNSSAVWTLPQRLDDTADTQGSNMVVDANGNLLVQWQDVDVNTGGNTIDTAESTNDGVSFTSPTITIDNQTTFGLVASDGRIRIGPFPQNANVEGLRQNQFPLIATDNNNQIVTVFQQANPDNGASVRVNGFTVASDSDVFIGRTSPGTGLLVGPGTSNSLVRVNQNSSSDMTDQFEPSVTVGADGSIHVLFLDRSQDPGTLSNGILTGNVDVGAAICISTDGGRTFTEQHLSSPGIGPVNLPGNPTLAQEQGFDPVFGDYIMVRSVPSGNNTQVIGALNAVDRTDTGIIDPVSVSYLFSGNVNVTTTTTNMGFHNGVATHLGACSEMDLAIVPGGLSVFAASNDFGDLNFNALPAPLNHGGGGGGVTPAPTPVVIQPVQAASGGGGGGCFIATAAYGSYLDPHVDTLRHFRDGVLMPTTVGRSFVAWYYGWSPEAAAFISERPVVRCGVRMALTPVVVVIEHPTGAAVALVLLVGAGIGRRRWLRR